MVVKTERERKGRACSDVVHSSGLQIKCNAKRASMLYEDSIHSLSKHNRATVDRVRMLIAYLQGDSSSS